MIDLKANRAVFRSYLIHLELLCKRITNTVEDLATRPSLAWVRALMLYGVYVPFVVSMAALALLLVFY